MLCYFIEPASHVLFTDIVPVKALNEVKFESEHYQSLLLQSQQTWAERFDRFDFITVLLCYSVIIVVTLTASFSRTTW